MGEDDLRARLVEIESDIRLLRRQATWIMFLVCGQLAVTLLMGFLAWQWMSLHR